MEVCCVALQHLDLERQAVDVVFEGGVLGKQQSDLSSSFLVQGKQLRADREEEEEEEEEDRER